MAMTVMTAASPETSRWRWSLVMGSRPNRADQPGRTTAGVVAVDADVVETSRTAQGGKGFGLLFGPAVAGEPGGTGFRLALDREQPAARREHAVHLGKSLVDVLPVVHGRQ